MTANGLIVAFVVAVWAAYFVPLVLRRYDDASKTSSLENLSALSRVIPRRARHDDEGTDDGDEEPQAPQVQADVAPERPRLTRETARLAARRRRNTLLTLLTVLAVVAGLGGFKVIPLVWVAVPAALVVAWLVACRVQVRSEYGAKPRAAGSPRATARSLSTSSLGKKARTVAPAGTASRRTSVDDEVTIVVDGQLEDVDPGRKHVMQLEALPSNALEEQLVIAVPSVATTGEALWDPLPVTLPTYVTKPRVGRTVRTIDFSGPGTWTSGHVEGESVELPGASDAAEGQPRRAAGQ